MDDDLRLLALHIRGRDAEAFSILVARHADMVYGACLRVCGDRQRAEDAAQECFLALARGAHQVRGSVGGWLHAVAVRTAMRQRRDQPIGDPEAIAALPAREGDRWRALLPRIDPAIAALPEDLRAPLVMRFLEGSTQQQVGEHLGLSQPTVHRRLREALAELRRMLEVDEGSLCAGLPALAMIAPTGLLGDLQRMALVAPAPAAPVAVANGVGWLAATVLAAASLVGVVAIVATPRAGGGTSPAVVSPALITQVPHAARTDQDPPPVADRVDPGTLPPVVVASGLRHGRWDGAAVKVSRDGQRIVAWDTSAEEVRIFDLASGDVLFSIERRAAAVAWSDDGRFIAIQVDGRSHGALEIWDWRRRQRIETYDLEDRTDPSYAADSLHFCLGDRRIVCVVGYRGLCIDRASGRRIRLQASGHSVVEAWDIADGRRSWTWGNAEWMDGYPGLCRVVGGTLIAMTTRARTATIALIDPSDGRHAGDLDGAGGADDVQGSGALLASADGRYLFMNQRRRAPASSSFVLTAWDAIRRTRLAAIELPSSSWLIARRVAIADDGTVRWMDGARLMAWAPGRDAAPREAAIVDKHVWLTALDATGDRLMTLGTQARVIDRAGRSTPFPALRGGALVAQDLHLAISRDGTLLATGDERHRVALWDLTVPRLIGRATVGTAHPADGSWMRLAFSSDGSALFIGRAIGADDHARWHCERWNLGTGERIPLFGPTEILQPKGYPQHAAVNHRHFILKTEQACISRDWVGDPQGTAQVLWHEARLPLEISNRHYLQRLIMPAFSARLGMDAMAQSADGRFTITFSERSLAKPSTITIASTAGDGPALNTTGDGGFDTDPTGRIVSWRDGDALRLARLPETAGQPITPIGVPLPSPGGLKWGSYGETRRDAKLLPDGRLLAAAQGHGTALIDTATGRIVARLMIVGDADWVVIAADGAVAGSPAGLAACRRLDDGRSLPLMHDAEADQLALAGVLHGFGIPAQSTSTPRVPTIPPIALADPGIRKRPAGNRSGPALDPGQPPGEHAKPSGERAKPVGADDF